MPNHELTPEQLWEFDCKGFVTVKAFFEQKLVERLATVAQAYEKPHYSQTSCLLDRHPAFKEAMFHPAVDQISQQFFGDYRIKSSVLVINPAKERREGGIQWPSWHQDADHGTHPYYATAWPCPLFQLRFFIALSDVQSPEHGGLALYPGSHRTKLAWPFDGKAVPEGCEIPCFKKGDCLLMHHATFHTALPNESDLNRVNVQVLTTPLWIRSNEAEAASKETLDALAEEHRKRILTDKW
jgi:ectoine hydroxylase-related dioxygenase (phytanoyl-CoA dioxygenase family)